MSVDVSQSDGLTVVTISSNPRSKWPIFCQILGLLCYSPVCSVSQHTTEKRTYITIVLGVLQIIAGILNIITGILFTRWGIHGHVMMFDAPFWIGGVFLISGILTLLASYCPGYFLFALALILNEVSAALAMIAASLYTWDLTNAAFYSDYELDTVLNFQDTNMTTRETADIMMIIFAVLQFCTNVTFVVLSLRRCGVTNSVKDSLDHKLLLEETSDNPACQKNMTRLFSAVE